jgi:hypothetical protein
VYGRLGSASRQIQGLSESNEKLRQTVEDALRSKEPARPGDGSASSNTPSRSIHDQCTSKHAYLPLEMGEFSEVISKSYGWAGKKSGAGTLG